jgi:hypothetical protein
MWNVDKRYLNNDRFVKAKKIENTAPSNVDLQIMQDTDKYYRVYNVTGNPFTDANTSTFHKSIGGYHAAKMKRYQEIIENHLAKGNLNVLDMLNTKYFIVAGQNGQQGVQQNQNACGNAWFINEVKFVPNADSEMLALTNFNPKNTVVIDQRFKDKVKTTEFAKDSLSSIALTYYSPDTLTYEYNASSDKFVVFSDIYYEQGWNAYVDGALTDHIRVNYLLRGMNVPAGKHTVEFRFEPKKYYLGEKVSFASSILLVLLIGLSVFLTFRKKQEVHV